jgi:hypothetical protein
VRRRLAQLQQIPLHSPALSPLGERVARAGAFIPRMRDAGGVRGCCGLFADHKSPLRGFSAGRRTSCSWGLRNLHMKSVGLAGSRLQRGELINAGQSSRPLEIAPS